MAIQTSTIVTDIEAMKMGGGTCMGLWVEEGGREAEGAFVV